MNNIISNNNIKRSLIHIVNKQLKEPFFINTEQNGANQLQLETYWTDFLQTIVDLGNGKILKNFRLSLEMEEQDPNG
jgi:hypothetical protein